MRVRTAILLATALQGAAALSATAQEQVYLLGANAANGDDFGHSVADAGDVDGDGIPDVVVGAPYNDSSGPDSGAVWVYSGRTGYLLWAEAGWNTGDHFGWSVDGLGDVNGDGLSDIIVGARGWDSVGTFGPFCGAVYILSGANGETLQVSWSNEPYAQYGYTVRGLGDIDGDGIGDYAHGMPWRDGPAGSDTGYYGVVSCATFDLLFNGWGNEAGALCGYSLDVLHATGIPLSSRLLVGEPGVDGAGHDRGRVRILNGLGTVVSVKNGSTDGEWFGASVAGIGDADGDFVNDFACGSPYADILFVGADAGGVKIYSGASDNFLFSIVGASAGANMGASLAGIGDFDGDGRGDVLAGAPHDSSVAVGGGEARLVSGASGLAIHSWTGGVNDSMGSAVSAAGDLNADGFADFIIGAEDAPFGAGEAYVHLGEVEAPTVYCTAKVNSQGCLPQISSEGVPSLSIANDFVVSAEDVLNQKFGILFWGLAPNDAPFMGGTLCVQPPVQRTPVQDSGGNAGPPDCSGSYAFHFSQAYMASEGMLAGDAIYAQFWSRDPAASFSTGLTDAIAFDVVP